MSPNPTTPHFEHRRATRERVSLLLGLYGPSGGGKTKSALRLADGIRRVAGGRTFVIDTEARRALHYADEHDFDHVPFIAPFTSLKYLAAIEYCVAQGASVVIVDSMSHEHEGPGGLLEYHAAEVERMCANAEDRGRRPNPDAYKMLAWQKPKSDRRRLINTILQIPVNFIFCFRAKEKLLIEKGKDPVNRGFMPITGEEFVYEMTATALLMPCADGVPTWQSKEIGESMMIKKPAYFRPVLDRYAGKPLNEDIGEAMALWAKGSATPEGTQPPPARQMSAGAAAMKARLAAWSASLAACATSDEVEARAQEPATFGQLGESSRRWVADQLAQARARFAPPPPTEEPGADGPY